MTSYRFYPSIGGIEEVSRILADEFVREGLDLTLVTDTPSSGPDAFPYPVVRQPSARQLLKLFRWADVVFQNNISLQYAWPFLFAPRRWVVAHHIWIRQSSGRILWTDRLKSFLIRFSRNITISEAMSESLSVKSIVIPDPFRSETFRVIPEIKRDLDLVFLGRLVSDKGLDVLLDALYLLQSKGLRPKLTVIGSGSKEADLQRQTDRWGLREQVSFVGAKRDEELVRLLNQHKILVVPSTWDEPFGVVALEGIACGCVVIGSRGGGLKDAIGRCGLTFQNGDAADLATVLKTALTDPGLMESLRAEAPAHLARFAPERVAKAYLQVMKQ